MESGYIFFSAKPNYRGYSLSVGATGPSSNGIPLSKRQLMSRNRKSLRNGEDQVRAEGDACNLHPAPIQFARLLQIVIHLSS